MTAPLRRNGKLVTTIAKGCENKVRYSDEYAARGAGQILQQQYGGKLYLYPCDICRGFHITKVMQKKEERAVTYKFRKTPR